MQKILLICCLGEQLFWKHFSNKERLVYSWKIKYIWICLSNKMCRTSSISQTTLTGSAKITKKKKRISENDARSNGGHQIVVINSKVYPKILIKSYVIHTEQGCFRKNRIHDFGLFLVGCIWNVCVEKNNSLQWLLEDSCGLLILV